MQTIITLVLTSHKCLESIPNPIPPLSARLCRAQTFVHVGEYAKTIHALAPNTHVALSDKTTRNLHLLHPLAKVDLPPFVDDFHPKMEVTLD
jgi:hypothetical protein